MNTKEIVAVLRQERDRLSAAIAALEGAAGSPARGRQGRHMSASARARIGAAMRARWAERKRGGRSKAVNQAGRKTGRRGMSAAARKRMSLMMKARWAARRKSASA
jgi:hypothetical protein